jgi:hypothetical protein
MGRRAPETDETESHPLSSNCGERYVMSGLVPRGVVTLHGRDLVGIARQFRRLQMRIAKNLGQLSSNFGRYNVVRG